MKIILTQGYKKNGNYIKEVELNENITMSMEEEALDMCIMLGKPKNLITAEICSLAVATGLSYDDIRSLHPFDYGLLKKEYDSFFSAVPQGTQEQTDLTQ